MYIKKNNKLISVSIVDDKLLEKYKTIWIRIEVLLNIKLNSLRVYDDDDDDDDDDDIYVYIDR